MRESLLKLFTRYCALVSSIFGKDSTADAEKKFAKYLTKQLQITPNVVRQNLFAGYVDSYTGEYDLFEEPELSVPLITSLFDKITLDTVQSISLNDRIIIILLLIDYFHTNVSSSKEDLNYLEVVCTRLGMSSVEFNDLCRFVTGMELPGTSANLLICRPGSEDKTEELEGSWIENNLPDEYKKTNEIVIDGLSDKLNILFLERSKMFILSCPGNDELVIEGSHTPVCKFKILEPGSNIKINNRSVVHYSDIKQKYLQFRLSTEIIFSAENLSLNQRKKNKGIKAFDVNAKSGELIGILGKEGVGKTTLLELLSGQIPPDTGNIIINGYNLRTNRYLLKSIIGYVPEEDMLFNELSVYDNLMLNARLFFSKMSEKELDKKVNQLLEKLKLQEYKNAIVGQIQLKNLQPGQRAMLNIALELLRSPKILIVDNPYYGLTSVESSRIVKLLHDYSYEGNLVFTSICHTNAQAFNMFDRLWIIDESGYPVYTGPTYNVAEYLKKILDITGLRDEADEITPEGILDLIDFRITDYSGRWGSRKISPSEWYENYLAHQKHKRKPAQIEIIPLPGGLIKLPNLETQFKIFNIRNFRIKFSNAWKIISTLLAGPVIASFLGFLLRLSGNEGYSFIQNPNIPLYLFSCTVISLFLGLIISADEIIKEKNLLIKEEFLEFSKFSYINSKIFYLFLIACIQTLLLTISGNLILGIKDMVLQFWLIFFSTSCFGIIIGLNLSLIHKKLNSIYAISIPIILILQIFLSPGIINFRNMNISRNPFVPVTGEMMVTRWAYEALAVAQFKNNRYERLLYPYDQNLSTYSYYNYDLLPVLEIYLDKTLERENNKDSIAEYLNYLRDGISQVSSEPDIFQFEYLNKLNINDFDNSIAIETKDFLTYLELKSYASYEQALKNRNDRVTFLSDSLGKEEFNNIKNDNYNNAIAALVMNKSAPVSIMTFHNRIYQVSDPVFQKPASNFGRATLYVPRKKFRGEILNTVWFNITIIWLFSFVFYLLLLIYPSARTR